MASISKTTTKSPNGLQRHFLIFVLLLLLVLLTIFISPFGIDLLVAGIIVTAVYPAHKKLMKGISFSRSLPAFISMLFIVILILVPFTLFGFFVVDQASDAYAVVSDRVNAIVESGNVDTPSKALELLPFSNQLQRALEYLPISTDDLLQTVRDALGGVSTFLLSKTTNILKHLSLLLVHLLVFLIALFYFLREGDRLVDYLKSILPLSKKYRQELFHKLSHLSYGIIYGIFGAAILQGLLVGIGFHFAGINNAAFWGVIAALFSPVPYIGTSVVWIPTVILLAIGGQYGVASLLFLWSAFVVGVADNAIKPYIIGSSAQLHPLATLLVLLGGTLVFGLKGLLFGPLVLTLTLSFLHIYRLEYEAVLESEKSIIRKKPDKKMASK